MESAELAAAVREAVREEIKPLIKRIQQLERSHTQAAKASAVTLGSIKESVVWNDLIVDAAICGLSLALLLGIAAWEAGRDQFCKNAPGWAKAAIPFCGSNAAAPATPSEDTRVIAFLDLIAWAEGTGDRYDIQYTGSSFSGDAHPRQIKCSNGLCSDAAGRYQFLSTTWDGLGLPDFSPANQDKGAIALLKRVGAYDLILVGDIEAAVCKAGPVWASLPCNDYNQPQKSTADLKAKYAEFLEKRKATAPSAIAASGGWINPVPSATLTSGFGWREHPIERFRRCHYGIDLAAPTGTPILAAKAGEVDGAGDVGDGYGYKVVLKHPDGSKSLYAHHSKNLVSKGQRVEQGEAIALLGSTGNSSGPHLHLEITDTSNNVIDPKPHIPNVKGPQSFGSIDPTKSAQCQNKQL